MTFGAAQVALRCAALSEEIGEAMLGTAFEEPRLLLVEQPGPWGRDGLRTSRFDARIAAALRARAIASNYHLLAVRRTGRSTVGSHRTWLSVDCRRQTMRCGSFEGDEELLDLDLDSDGNPLDGPMFLVCTHGTRDPCCAIRGRPVAAAFASHHVDVWECSHLGGHRFGANVLVLPAGDLYGRIGVNDVPDLVDPRRRAHRLSSLRGRVGLPAAAQAGLVAVLERLPVDRRDIARVEAMEALANGDSVVVVSAEDLGTYYVTVKYRESSSGLPSCDADADTAVATRYFEPGEVSAIAPTQSSNVHPI